MPIQASQVLQPCQSPETVYGETEWDFSFNNPERRK